MMILFVEGHRISRVKGRAIQRVSVASVESVSISPDDGMTMCIGIVQHATTESDVYIKTSLIFTLS